MDFMHFDQEAFSHITCLYFTIYYIKDKKRFFKNCFDWLMPTGHLAIHLVNRDKFDPIIEAGNPLHIVSPQKLCEKKDNKVACKILIISIIRQILDSKRKKIWQLLMNTLKIEEHVR